MPLKRLEGSDFRIADLREQEERGNHYISLTCRRADGYVLCFSGGKEPIFPE